MPETSHGRQAILNYLKDHEVSRDSMATVFGVSTQYLGQVLNGKRTGKKANELILSVIDKYGIR